MANIPDPITRKISIHAPTRGATKPERKTEMYLAYFNPRSHEGSDPDITMQGWTEQAFQSTLPRGERLNAIWRRIFEICISIHAPTRGATDGLGMLLEHLDDISIHAPTRGATPRPRHSG